MTNQSLITKFYTAFAEKDFATMNSCYHPDVVFEDPAFGRLEGKKARKMWEMLLSRPGAGATITFNNVEANEETGSANWRAEYLFGKAKRNVINEVSASFKFKEGLIIEHTDTFDVWKWSRQAMGPVGMLLGWSGFLKNKIQKSTNSQLAEFMKK